MDLTLAAQIVACGTCLFLAPFFLAAYFAPMSRINLSSVGLVPSESDRIAGLSNLRGTVGGLRLAIIAMIAFGAYYDRSDLLLGAAILVGSIAAGRYLSLGLDGWNQRSFITATGELVIIASLLHLGGFI